jgi:DNA-binding transcriptional ArsR family regulator
MNPLKAASARDWALELLRAYDVAVPDSQSIYIRESGIAPQPSLDCQRPWRQVLTKGAGEGSRNVDLTSLAGKLRRVLPLKEGLTVLSAVNATQCIPPVPEDEVLRLAEGVWRRYGGPPTLAMVNMAEAEEPGPRRWRIEGILPEGHPAIMFGDGGHGKSYLALFAATAVAAGFPYLGLATERGPVLYLDWELDNEEFTRRAYQVARSFGLERPPPGLLYVRAPAPLLEITDQIAHLVTSGGLGLVVVDSLGPACGSSDPEAARFTIPVMVALRDLGTASLAVDHQAKMQQGQDYAAKTPFGSAYKYNLARSIWQVEKADKREGSLDILLRHRKANFGPLLQDIGVRLTFEGHTVRLDRVNPAEVPGLFEKLPARERVLAALREVSRARVEELVEATGLPEGTARNALTALRKDSKVETDSGWWRAIPSSRSYIGKELGIVSEQALTTSCLHRPPGEVEDRWTRGIGGDDPHVCRCCGGPVRPDSWAEGLCSVCRNGRRVADGRGHLVRLALDLGARLAEGQ